MDAIKILEEPIREWQKQESLKRLAEMKTNPDSQIPEEDFFKKLDDENG